MHRQAYYTYLDFKSVIFPSLADFRYPPGIVFHTSLYYCNEIYAVVCLIKFCAGLIIIASTACSAIDTKSNVTVSRIYVTADS